MNFMINPLYAVMVRQAKVRHCGGLRESSTGLSGQWCLKLDLSPTTKELNSANNLNETRIGIQLQMIK